MQATANVPFVNSRFSGKCLGDEQHNRELSISCRISEARKLREKQGKTKQDVVTREKRVIKSERGN